MIWFVLPWAVYEFFDCRRKTALQTSACSYLVPTTRQDAELHQEDWTPYKNIPHCPMASHQIYEDYRKVESDTWGR